MKLTKSICCVIVCGFLSALQAANQVSFGDQQIIKQQAEDLMEFVAIADPWGNAIAEYSRKNGIDLKIKCKICTDKDLNIGEFDGCLLAWVSKAILGGHGTFKKVKALVDDFIRLLSSNASSEELINFMLNASNDMAQVCSHCHGVEWQKITDSFIEKDDN